MAKAQYTPGPWGVHHGENYSRVLMKPDSITDDYIAEVFSDMTGTEYDDDDNNRAANANLMRAAPELLEALEAMIAMVNKTFIGTSNEDIAVLAKASRIASRVRAVV